MMIADELTKEPDNRKLLKDMTEHSRLVKECNEKLEAYEAELVSLPREMDKVIRRSGKIRKRSMRSMPG